MASELVNELTGEAMTLREYIDQGRAIERSIFRSLMVLSSRKSSLKAAKEDRLRAVSALRATAREVRLRATPTAMRGRASKAEKGA